MCPESRIIDAATGLSAICLLLHFTVKASEKICLRYFKICLTYFKISQTYFLPTENPFKNQAKSADKNRYAGTVFVRPGIFHARIAELYKCALVFFSA